LQLIERVHLWLRRGRQPHVVIITDVEMPGLNGLDALVRIHRALPNTPVIVVTGFGDATIRERARRLGASAVFTKPVDLKLLRDTATLLAAV
jgi:CheY-like chemotaxis protein